MYQCKAPSKIFGHKKDITTVRSTTLQLTGYADMKRIQWIFTEFKRGNPLGKRPHV